MGDASDGHGTGSTKLLCWNIAALKPTLKNIDLKYGSYLKFLSQLQLDFACFQLRKLHLAQETKLNDAQLTKDVVCVDGYESYWAVSREKKGYSGVVSYVSDQWSAIEADADCLGSGESDIDREGRVVISDHGAFVLINVYVPNAGERPARARLPFKLEFLRALKRKADLYCSQGRQVLLVGDFNIAASEQDVHPRIGFDGLYAPDERAAFDVFVSPEGNQKDNASSAYIDVWRHFHPGVTDVFTVWEERISARAFNQGLRIDYVLCSPGLLPHIRSCEVISTEIIPPKWSDHAGILLEFTDLRPPRKSEPCLFWVRRRESLIDSRQRSIKDMFMAGRVPPRKKARTADLGTKESLSEPQREMMSENRSGIARFFAPSTKR